MTKINEIDKKQLHALMEEAAMVKIIRTAMEMEVEEVYSSLSTMALLERLGAKEGEPVSASLEFTRCIATQQLIVGAVKHMEQELSSLSFDGLRSSHNDAKEALKDVDGLIGELVTIDVAFIPLMSAFEELLASCLKVRDIIQEANKSYKAAKDNFMSEGVDTENLG